MKKVLIVDDDMVFQKTMTDKLKEKGYEVISAMDGEEGLKQATTSNPDIMLLDIKMPKMDGISLLRQLRKNDDMPKMPILITSNMTGTENIADGISLGVRGYIIKSNETLDTIVREVEAVLNPDVKVESVVRQADPSPNK